jgi:hypothetical protein
MPAVTARFDSLGKMIKAIIAVLALLPGAAVLTGLIDIPPTLVELVKALSVFAGIVLLAGIALLSPVIARIRTATVVAVAVGGVVAGAGFAVGYRSFADRHIVLIDADGAVERFVIPSAPSPAVDRIVEPYGGDYAEALMASPRRERLRLLMEEESGASVAMMVVLMLAAQTLMVGGVAIAGWKLALADEAPAAPKPPARRPARRAPPRRRGPAGSVT